MGGGNNNRRSDLHFKRYEFATVTFYIVHINIDT